jgi:hypothetical protein
VCESDEWLCCFLSLVLEWWQLVGLLFQGLKTHETDIISLNSFLLTIQKKSQVGKAVIQMLEQTLLGCV